MGVVPAAARICWLGYGERDKAGVRFNEMVAAGELSAPVVIGRSIHAGQVTVADGTPLAAAKIERVLTDDPGMGVIRHIDSGDAPDDAPLRAYPDGGVRVPMGRS